MFWSKNNEEQEKVEASQSKETVSSSPKPSQPTMGVDFERVQSALGAGTVIQGKLSFDTPVRIDGKLSGEVFSTSTLIIGETGVVEAQVEAESLIILGKVHGTVNVREKVQLRSGGELQGEISARTLSVEIGAVLNGSCKMPVGESAKKKAPVLARPSDATVIMSSGAMSGGTIVTSADKKSSGEKSSDSLEGKKEDKKEMNSKEAPKQSEAALH